MNGEHSTSTIYSSFWHSKRLSSGTITFLLYINDLTSFHLSQMSSLSLYADDMLLYKPITSDISYLNATLDAGNFGFSINISLNGSTTLYMEMYLKILWEIVKSNGEYEVYTVVNYSHLYLHGRCQNNAERGLSFGGLCYGDCDLLLAITATDLRYNGAKITGIVRAPECFNTSNTTNTTTLRIQGEFCYSYLFICS